MGVEIGDGSYGGAANVGFNPTFGGTDLSVEVFVFDFDENIYEKFIRVYFIERLRDEKRFSGPEELTAQIHKDVAKARQILSQSGRWLRLNRKNAGIALRIISFSSRFLVVISE